MSCPLSLTLRWRRRWGWHVVGCGTRGVWYYRLEDYGEVITDTVKRMFIMVQCVMKGS
jgi:hypothetical protein